MANLKLYNASAGSGKTYTLTRDYLQLVLAQPQARVYRHILAITFTKKATAEMKRRILEKLDELQRGEDPELCRYLAEATGLEPSHIRTNSGLVLQNILQDYGAFSVSTIDSFNQQVLRAFAREQGLGADFGVELDLDLVVHEAVDRLLAKANTRDSAQLTRWLTTFIFHQIEEGSSHKIKAGIMTLGKELFREDAGSDPLQLEGAIDALGEIKKELDLSAKAAKNEVKRLAMALDNHLQGYGLSVSHATSVVAKWLQQMLNGDLKEPSATVSKVIDDSAAIAKAADKAKFKPAMDSGGHQLFCQLVGANHAALVADNTYRAFNSNYYQAGLLAALSQEIADLLKEKNLFLLADTNRLLRVIIGRSTTPLVYEKIGQYYRHFFIDEFQDTSRRQWDNFKPLLEEGLASDFDPMTGLPSENTSLLVGDTKQSIYRFRNGDWRLMASEVPGDPELRRYIQRKNLQDNYRSSATVIHFNNELFSRLPGRYFDNGREKLEEMRPYLSLEEYASLDKLLKLQKDVYDGVQQTPSPNSLVTPGHVAFEIIEKVDTAEDEDGEEPPAVGQLQRIVDHIEDLHDHGFTGSDVAILVRSHADGARIMQHVMAYAQAQGKPGVNYRIVSQESLLVSASAAVQVIVNSLHFLADRNNTLAAAAILGARAKLETNRIEPDNAAFDQICDRDRLDELLPAELLRNRVFLSKLSLYELSERVIQLFGLNTYADEIPFLTTFLSLVHDYERTEVPLLPAFLEYWEESGKGTRVQPGEGLDAIQLETIHKSKGLEFKAVILPNVGWELSKSPAGHTHFVWCPARRINADLPEINIPLNYNGKTLGKSLYALEFMQEYLARLQDSLNLAYVANTRACQVLIMMVERGSRKTGPKSLGGVLESLMADLPGMSPDSDAPEHILRWTTGPLPQAKARKPREAMRLIDYVLSKDWNRHVKIKSRAKYFALDENNILPDQSDAINLGEAVHTALARAQNLTEALGELASLSQQGLLTALQLETCQSSVKRAFALPEMQQWYGPDYRRVAERELVQTVDGQAQFRRPDMVFLNHDHAVVLDFKTGHMHEGYTDQVNGYKQLIADATGLPVQGFLLFLKTTELKRVD